MTPNRPHLFLNRLVVITHTGVRAYDETFHLGVNIIRGENSSGKSTIANFIFFVLGGDFDNWTTEAIKSREVYAEVDINGAVITLRRYVSEGGNKPMHIFYGPLEEAINNTIEWMSFPYRQTPGTSSFSNVLFQALEYPEVRSDADSNITMHQLLRLIYIDQETPTQSLFRFERFDLPLTRQTIAEVLLGIYDDSLYNFRLNLRADQRSYDEKKKQLENLSRLLVRSGTEISIVTLDQEIQNAQQLIEKNDQDILELRKNRPRTSARTATNTEALERALSKTKGELSAIRQYAEQLNLDIFDSRQFIKTLQNRITELNNSIITRKVLGELPLTHCPQCLSPLEIGTAKENCILCKKPLSEDVEKANAKRLLLEMQLQVKESTSLLEDKERRLQQAKSEIDTLVQRGRVEQSNLNSAIANAQSTRDDRIDDFLVRKGELTQQLIYLGEQRKLVEIVDQLKKELVDLAASIKQNQIEISEREDKQKSNYELALRKVKEFAFQILRSDLDRQSEFKTGRNLEIDFLRDTFTLDGGNNFSASSKTYFKNAILFAIFFASVELDFFRYPRFILCDNMEDKGMEKIRTQNFQNVISKISSGLSKPHQIIFTTSMVSDELNNTNLCVGEEYSSTNKSLKMISS